MTAPADHPPSELDVEHDEEGHRYLLSSDGEHVGLIDYRATGDTLDFHHTEIRPDARGRGLGGVLVRGALENVQDNDRRVIPSCWFVRAFIDAHPEFADLVTSRR